MEISTWSLNFVNRYCTYYLGESIRFDSQEEAWGYTFMEGKIEFRNGNSPRHVISALHETNNYPSWSKIIECLCDQSQQLLANQSRWFWALKVALGRYDDHPTWDYCKKYVIFQHWMAPELLEGKQYSFKVDVYSYGILLWEILSRTTPYSELQNPMAILKYVVIDHKRPTM